MRILGFLLSLGGGVGATVQLLKRGNFTQSIKNPEVDYWLLKFYAPWCGHCKALAPEFELADKLIQKFKTQQPDVVPNIQLGKIDCSRDKVLCSWQGVSSYPSVELYQGERVIARHPKGLREVESILTLIVTALYQDSVFDLDSSPSSSSVSLVEVEKFKKNFIDCMFETKETPLAKSETWEELVCKVHYHRNKLLTDKLTNTKMPTAKTRHMRMVTKLICNSEIEDSSVVIEFDEIKQSLNCFPIDDDIKAYRTPPIIRPSWPAFYQLRDTDERMIVLLGTKSQAQNPNWEKTISKFVETITSDGLRSKFAGMVVDNDGPFTRALHLYGMRDPEVEFVTVFGSGSRSRKTWKNLNFTSNLRDQLKDIVIGKWSPEIIERAPSSILFEKFWNRIKITCRSLYKFSIQSDFHIIAAHCLFLIFLMGIGWMCYVFYDLVCCGGKGWKSNYERQVEDNETDSQKLKRAEMVQKMLDAIEETRKKKVE